MLEWSIGVQEIVWTSIELVPPDREIPVFQFFDFYQLQGWSTCTSGPGGGGMVVVGGGDF